MRQVLQYLQSLRILLMKQSRVGALVFITFFLLSCSNYDNTSDCDAFFLPETKKLSLNFILNLKVPDNLEKNLNMFNYSTMYLKLSIFDKSKLIANKIIERKIKYDRWNNDFIIEDIYLDSEKRYNDFNSFSSNIYIFKNIFFEVNDTKSRELIVKYDFYLKSLEFLPPFKLIEYDGEFGNIKLKNRKCRIYAK